MGIRHPVKSAHCLGCKAGLAESCSHAASVLFYIEAWTRIRGKFSCTEVKCTWLLPSFVKEVPYAKMRFINLTSARKLKANLDEKIENLGENREATSVTGSRRKVTVKLLTQTGYRYSLFLPLGKYVPCLLNVCLDFKHHQQKSGYF